MSSISFVKLQKRIGLERSSTIPQGTLFGRQPKSIDDETDRE